MMIPTSYLTRDSYRDSFEADRPVPARKRWPASALLSIRAFLARAWSGGRNRPRA